MATIVNGMKIDFLMPINVLFMDNIGPMQTEFLQIWHAVTGKFNIKSKEIS